MKIALALIVLAGVSSPLLAGTPPLSSYEIERGRAFAERHCATCHAVGRTGTSPYNPAPPFRTLHERYDIEALAETLAEGIIVGHRGAREMPQSILSPAEIDDLLAYMKWLEM